MTGVLIKQVKDSVSPFVDAALAFVQLEAAPVTLQESVPVGACDPVPTTSAVNES